MSTEDEEIVYVIAEVPEGADLAANTTYTLSGLDSHAPKITIGEGDAAKTLTGVHHVESITSTVVVAKTAADGADADAHVVAVSNNELK